MAQLEHTRDMVLEAMRIHVRSLRSGERAKRRGEVAMTPEREPYAHRMRARARAVSRESISAESTWYTPDTGSRSGSTF